MPLPVQPTRHRPSDYCPPSTTAAAKVISVPGAMESGGAGYAAGDPKEVAKHFPGPTAEVADRLVNLLLPRGSAEPRRDDAA